MAIPAALWRAVPNQSSHRVTSLELFFDLVYVFAFTQVTAWIAHEHSAVGTAQGLVTLAILWWTWIAWAWLGNVFKADTGAPLAGFLASGAAVFALALSIRHVWTAEGGSLAPMVFVVAYLAIRVVHAGVYLWAARGEAALRTQILITAAAWLPAAALLAVGAMLPPGQRLWWWAGTLALDLASTWILAIKGPGWTVSSPGHFAERGGLIVILALGESVVAVGVAAQGIDLSVGLVGLAIVGVGAAVALWWPYFKAVGPAVEDSILEADARRAVAIARDSYTYLHLPLVAGIVLAAAGVEEAVLAIDHHDNASVAIALVASGAALFSAATAALMALAGRGWQLLAASAAFFASAAWWMRALEPALAISLTAVVLIVVGAATPRVRARRHGSPTGDTKP